MKKSFKLVRKGSNGCNIICHDLIDVSSLISSMELFYIVNIALICLCVVTCVGVWVVTEWSVSCLDNSQDVSCRGRKPTIRLQPTLLRKSPQEAADRG